MDEEEGIGGSKKNDRGGGGKNWRLQNKENGPKKL